MPSKMIDRVRRHDDLMGHGKHLGWAKRKTAEVLGATVAPTTPMSDKWKKLKACGAKVGVGTAVGAGLGYYGWKKHRVLGALAGAAVGVEAAGVACGVGVDWRLVASNVGAVVGSLNWRRHPVLGYLLGGLVGGVGADLAGVK